MNPGRTPGWPEDVRIVLPDSLDLITPYVLREQRDWFEDEIKFLRRLLQPGDRFIDVGANYGVYTLCLAHKVGPTGHGWAFEPASGTATLLAESISANGFTQVTLERSAVSSATGTGLLQLKQSPELNALAHGQVPTGDSETVLLVTLDERMHAYGWLDIDCLKLDAEGEEANIIEGGRRFFSALSPLVQYEVKDDQIRRDASLMQTFASMGYDSYRLVPGLDLLVPFGPESTADAYLINLFCCKGDRAARLAARHSLVSAGDIAKAKTQLAGVLDAAAGTNACNWRRMLSNLPYASSLASLWQDHARGLSRDLDQALSLYALSRDSSYSAADRFAGLEASLGLFTRLCERGTSPLQFASLARVARDYGARAVAVDALQKLGAIVFGSADIDTSEPFLAPGEYFDQVSPGVRLRDWLKAAMLEEFERAAAFSSFYTGETARGRLEAIRDLGFGSPDMQQRLQLLEARWGPGTS
jgi:protein O-GlcNAc transferase